MASNFNPLATIDDGSCNYSSCEAYLYIYEIIEEENLIVLVDSSYGEGNLSYMWDFGDGNTSTEYLPSHSYEEYGTYNLCLTISDDFGCVDEFCIEITFVVFGYIIDGNVYEFSAENTGFSITLISNSMISIDELETNNQSNIIYPNPANTWLFVKMNTRKGKNILYTISDVTGKLIRQESSKLSMIYISDLSNGVYVISWGDDKAIVKRKFVVSR